MDTVPLVLDLKVYLSVDFEVEYESPPQRFSPFAVVETLHVMSRGETLPSPPLPITSRTHVQHI
jgi:hypothetical protein